MFSGEVVVDAPTGSATKTPEERTVDNTFTVTVTDAILNTV